MIQAPITVQAKAAPIKAGLTFLAEHAYPTQNCQLNVVSHNKHLWFLTDDLYGRVGFSVPCNLRHIWGRVNLQEAYFFLSKLHKKDTLSLTVTEREIHFKCSKGSITAHILDDRFSFGEIVTEIPLKGGYLTPGDCTWFGSNIRSTVFLNVSLGTTLWSRLDASAEIGLDYPVSPLYDSSYMAAYSRQAFHEFIDCLAEIETKKVVLYTTSLGLIGSRMRIVNDDMTYTDSCLLRLIDRMSFTAQFSLPERMPDAIQCISADNNVAYLSTEDESEVIQGTTTAMSYHAQIPLLGDYLPLFAGRNVIITVTESLAVIKSGPRYVAIDRRHSSPSSAELQ